MRGSAKAIAAPVGAWLVAAACSPFGASAADVDPAEEAGPGPTTALDAGADVVEASDGATSCAARFCSDFDPPREVPPFGWDQIATGSNPDRYVITGDGVSAPNALRLKLTVTNGPADVVHLEKRVDGDAGQVATLDVAFRMRVISRASSSANARLLQVGCKPTSAPLFKLKLTPESQLKIYDTDDSSHTLGDVSDGVWQSVRVSMVLGGQGTVTAVIGETGAKATGANDNSSCSTSLFVQLGLFVTDNSGSGDYEVLFDDVTIDWR